MLVSGSRSPQGISKYSKLVSARISFTWNNSRAYLADNGSFSKDWIKGGTWVGEDGWYLLGPIELMKWSDEE